MPKQSSARVYRREFKEAAVQRIIAGEKVSAVATDLQVHRKLLYDWWGRYERGGAEGLLPPGRPARRPPGEGVRGPRRGRRSRKPQPSSETVRIAELESKVAQQALELDFFEGALRHIEALRPRTGGRGAMPSSRPSTR
jgi:transposase